MGKYNTDKERLKQLKKLSKDKDRKMSAKQSRELTVLKAKEQMLVQDMSRETMIKIKSYLKELVSLNRATEADKMRLIVIEEKLEQ